MIFGFIAADSVIYWLPNWFIKTLIYWFQHFYPFNDPVKHHDRNLATYPRRSAQQCHKCHIQQRYLSMGNPPVLGLPLLRGLLFKKMGSHDVYNLSPYCLVIVWILFSGFMTVRGSLAGNRPYSLYFFFFSSLFSHWIIVLSPFELMLIGWLMIDS